MIIALRILAIVMTLASVAALVSAVRLLSGDFIRKYWDAVHKHEDKKTDEDL